MLPSRAKSTKRAPCSLRQFGQVALGREHHADGVSEPMEAPQHACAALGCGASARGDVQDVAVVRHGSL